MKMDAIIGAGGQIKQDDPLTELMDIGISKALLPIAGKPMIQWTLDAVSKTDQIDNVIIIGLNKSHNLSCENKTIYYLENQDSIFENARAGCKLALKLKPTADKVLWISADLPLIESKMLDWFITTVKDTNHELYYQIIDQSVMEQKFPQSKRTYTTLKNRTVCGGDVSAVNPNIASNIHPAFKRISEARKSVIKQASLIGLWPLILMLTKQMNTTRAEKLIQNRLGLDGIFVDTPYAEMGMDVDKPEQYQIAQELLQIR